MKFFRAFHPALVGTLMIAATSIGCRDRSPTRNVSADETAELSDDEIDPKHLLQPSEEVLNKLLTSLLTGEGRPIEVENELAGRNLATLRKSAAETITPNGLPVIVITGQHRFEGYFKVENGILEKALPEKARPFIIGVEDGEDTCSISVNLDHWFTYYFDKDFFFLGFGPFQH